MTAPLRAKEPRIEPTIVRVALDARSYDIVIGRGLIASLGQRVAALKPGAKAAIVTDANVARAKCVERPSSRARDEQEERRH